MAGKAESAYIFPGPDNLYRVFIQSVRQLIKDDHKRHNPAVLYIEIGIALSGLFCSRSLILVNSNRAKSKVGIMLPA